MAKSPISVVLVTNSTNVYPELVRRGAALDVVTWRSGQLRRGGTLSLHEEHVAVLVGTKLLRDPIPNGWRNAFLNSL